MILLYREYTPDAKPPYEEDPRLYHHIPELYERDPSYLNQLEMKSSDIITRYCFYLYHAEYPMKFVEAHKYMTFRMYKVLQEENIPVDEEVTQTKLHEGFINSTIMRILHEVHGLVTPYSPEIILQEERRAKSYTDFSPQEYECLKSALGLISVNKHLDLEKAMKVLQWFKLFYWKDQMKQDIDCMLLHIQTKLYAGLDEMFGEMHNLFLEEKEEAT